MNDAVNANSSRVVIGMDPHKRSVTIEVMRADETVLGGGRYATDEAVFAAMRRYVSQFPDHIWAIEGCADIGHHVAMRLSPRVRRSSTCRRNCRHGPGVLDRSRTQDRCH